MLGALLLLNLTIAHSSTLPGLESMQVEKSPLQVTWFGVTTLLLDDGETQILIDGWFTRPQFDATVSVGDGNLLDIPAEPDLQKIKEMIKSADLSRLAAITPVHSHFDHAMDLGVIAKLTGAQVLGSESTANIARGAGVPEDNISVVADSGRFSFGKFTVALLRTAHLPLQDGGPPIPGNIDTVLVPPAAIGAWKEGGSYSIIITHPAGTSLIQGSAGYLPGALDSVKVDTVFLGIGGLGRVGDEHTAAYFNEVVSATRPRCVIPVHFDDFITSKLGDIVFKSSSKALDALIEHAASERIGLAAPVFGVPTNPFSDKCDTEHSE